MELKMKKKLTPREKVMIAFLINLIIIFISVKFFILPEINKNKTLLDENKSLTALYHLATNNKGVSDRIKQDYEESKQKMEATISQVVGGALTDEELDQYFTAMIIRHGLKPVSLTIEYPKSGENPQQKAYKHIKIANITINTAGNFENLIQMISEIDNIQYLTVLNTNSKIVSDSFEHSIKIQTVILAGE